MYSERILCVEYIVRVSNKSMLYLLNVSSELTKSAQSTVESASLRGVTPQLPSTGKR